MVSTQNARTERITRPYYESEERPDHYELRVFMPGVNKQGIDISLHDEELTLSGTRTHAVPEGWRPISRETRGEKYLLRVRLNVDIDGEKISARTEDGVLYLTLPKAEASKPRQIEIR